MRILFHTSMCLVFFEAQIFKGVCKPFRYFRFFISQAFKRGILVSDFQEKAVEVVEQLIGTIRFEKVTPIP